MSATKRLYFPEIYKEIDGIKATPSREDLEAEALKIACACYYYDLANSIDGASDQDLKDLIADPYLAHRNNDDDINECPEYQAEQAEAIRDGMKEDGLNV